MPSRRVIRSAIAGFLGLLLAQRAGAAQPGQATVVRDVHYGEVLLYFYQQEYFPAIVRLLAAREAERLEHHDAEAELLLGGLYLSYGHHLRAAAIFERLLASSDDAAIRDRTWFFLARIRHQRGWRSEARQALANIRRRLPDGLEAERRLLQARLHIDAGEYDRAVALLEGWEGAPEWTVYARYNLGVALIADGRMAEGAAVLDALGVREARGEEQQALRDKANLALGYAWLQDEQPAAARPVLARVRLAGPFSNKALSAPAGRTPKPATSGARWCRGPSWSGGTCWTRRCRNRCWRSPTPWRASMPRATPSIAITLPSRPTPPSRGASRTR